MLGEIGDGLGPAAAREVGRGRAEDPARAGDRPGDEVRVGDRAAAHGEVHALLDEVGDALVEAQFHLDARISREEFGQRRQQEVAAEGAGHVDAQAPGRLLPAAAQGLLGLGQLREHPPAMAEVIRAGRRDGDLARRAVQELHAEAPLEPPDVGAHHRARSASSSAARVKDPSSATRAKACIACSSSMTLLVNINEQ